MVAKLFPTLAGIVLVVPFLVVAVLVGHYALAGAGRGANNLLFGALALCGVAYSAAAGRPAGRQLSWPAVARRSRP